MACLFICLLFLAVPALAVRHEKYEGHQLYRVAGSPEEFSFLQAKLDIVSATPSSRSASGKLEALVRLSPEEKQQWLQYFSARNMAYTKIVDNLADILRSEESTYLRARKYAREDNDSAPEEDNDSAPEEDNDSAPEEDNDSTPEEDNDSTPEEDNDSAPEEDNDSALEEDNEITWDRYYNYDEINAYLDELGSTHSQLVTVINAGLSYEGRQIKYVRISTTNFEVVYKPLIIIDGGVHAREWITTSVALYIINQLVVEKADEDLLNKVDWIIIPLANPDGYTYSQEEDRMWRKTRSFDHPGSFDCPGVDINRNFDHHHGTMESTFDPCSNVYEGPSAFSSSEARVIRDAVLQNINRARLYLSLHSFTGGMFLYAWGNNGTLPSNGLALHLAGINMANAIQSVAPENYQPYTVGNAGVTLYYTTGTSRDWTRAVGIPLTYTVEIEDYGYGFLVPEDKIEQIVKELWAGVASGGHYVANLYGV